MVYKTGRPVAAVAAEIGVEEQLLGRWVLPKRDSAGGGILGPCSMPMTVPSCSGCAARTPHYVWTLYPKCELPHDASVQKFQSVVPRLPGAGNIGRGRPAPRFYRDAARAGISEWRWGLLRDHGCCDVGESPGDDQAIQPWPAAAAFCTQRTGRPVRLRPASTVTEVPHTECPQGAVVRAVRRITWRSGRYSVRAVFLSPSYAYAGNAATMRPTTRRLRSIPR